MQDLLKDLEPSSINEVWDVSFINAPKHHFVLILDGGIHFCTCMLLGTLGVVCRHYWRVLLESTIATFHITIVPKRWYHDIATDTKNPWKETAIQATGSIQPQAPSLSLKLWQQPQYQTSSSQEIMARQQISRKIAYGSLHGECKHLINLALEEDYDLHSVLAQTKAEIFAKREERLAELAKKQKHYHSESSNESDKENANSLLNLDNIQNPALVISKGRPRSSRLKAASEGGKRGQRSKLVLTNSNQMNKIAEQSKSRKRTECQYCKELGIGDEQFGHNQAGCKRKKADMTSNK